MSRPSVIPFPSPLRRLRAQLAPLVFPRAKRGQLFLVLCEVMGNLEVLEDQGRIARVLEGGVWHFFPASAERRG